MLVELWSGGQTGVDRAALDVAMELGLLYGGWVPLGRMAEDGALPLRYRGMREASTAEPAHRTELNVVDTHATLVLRLGPATGGTRRALDVAQRLGRPVLDLDLERSSRDAAVAEIRNWLPLIGTMVRLNVAGPRESESPGIQARARAVLMTALDGFARGA